MISEHMNTNAGSVDLARPRAIAGSRLAAVAIPWYRVALGFILAIAAGLNFWQLNQLGYGNTYYAAAVKSMMMSWHNFFFVAFDPGGFVTIDKPPLAFWFQVASAKVFGYSGFSLLLPQAIAGVLSVAVLYNIVRRIFGVGAGLLAALFLALTPVLVATSRSNIIDTTLVLFMLLGAWAVSRAVESGKLRWLLLCAVFVGLGFNVKMLEAYLVVPAFGLAYLLGSRRRWRTRLLHLFLAAVVMLSVSLSWAVAVDLTPANQRPWVDSTSTNSELSLALGYNGLQRLLGTSGNGGTQPRISVSTSQLQGLSSSGSGSTPNGATSSGTAHSSTSSGTSSSTNTSTAARAGAARSGSSSSTSASTSTQASGANAAAQGAPPAGNGGAGGGGGLFNNGTVGPLRLLGGALGGQASWLLPLSLIGLVMASTRRFRFPLDPERKALVLWGTWLLTEAAFFSVAGFFHSYYLVTLAPAVAALAAIAVVSMWRDYRDANGARWRGFALPVALLVTAGSQAYMLSNFPSWSSWLTPLIVGITLLAAAALVLARVRRFRTRIGVIAATVGILALLLAPTAWAVDTVRAGSGGLVPSAGPSATSTSGAGGGSHGFVRGGNAPSFGQRPGSNGTATTPPPGGFGGTRPSGGFGGTRPSGGFAGGGAGIGPDSSSVNANLLTYLEQHQGTTKYLVAVSRSTVAAPYIIQTGKPVMSLGGFSGSNPILTTTQLESLVKQNVVHYFLVSGNQGDTLSAWIQAHGKLIPSTAWQGSGTSSAASGGQQLYYVAN